MGQRARILFPVSTVEWLVVDDFYGVQVQTARINADTVWVRSRHVEGFNATVLAKVMLRFMATEGVERERLLSFCQIESTLRDQQVLVVVDVTNRAVTGMCI